MTNPFRRRSRKSLILRFASSGRTLVTNLYVRDSSAARDSEGSKQMQIGKPLRTIVVEPLELPVEQPKGEPEPHPMPSPDSEPEQVPAKQ